MTAIVFIPLYVPGDDFSKENGISLDSIIRNLEFSDDSVKDAFVCHYGSIGMDEIERLCRAAASRYRVSEVQVASDWDANPRISVLGKVISSVCINFEERYDKVVTIPLCWRLDKKLDVSGHLFSLDQLKDSHSILLGGCPTSHVDSGNVFSTTIFSKDPRYSKLNCFSWGVTGLEMLESPAVRRTRLVSEVYKGRKTVAKYSRCGWEDGYDILVPNELITSDKSERKEWFRDIVGVCPVYWDSVDPEVQTA